MRWVSVLLAGVLGIFLFVGTAVAILYNDLTQTLNDSVLSTEHLKPPQSGQDEPKEPELTDGFAGIPVNILLMGSDARIGQSGVVNPNDPDDTMRSDTTLVMHISADRQSVTLVSIPRDIWMLLPECQRSDGSVSMQQWGQFNWAFSYGSGGTTDDVAGAIACTEKTVEEMTGVDLNAFAVIDFNGFGAMINALGGVEICLEETLVDYDYIGREFEAGCQVMDAVTATQYARVRHVGDGSDMGRIGRQQELIGAMVKQALGSNLLTESTSLYQFVTATLKALTLSPSLGNIYDDMGLINSLRGINPANIRFTTMPVLTTDFNANRLMPKEPINSELWASIANDQPLPPGIVYMNMDGEYFTVGADGVPVPGGDPRTDDEIGYFQGWIPQD